MPEVNVYTLVVLLQASPLTSCPFLYSSGAAAHLTVLHRCCCLPHLLPLVCLHTIEVLQVPEAHQIVLTTGCKIALVAGNADALHTILLVAAHYTHEPVRIQVDGSEACRKIKDLKKLLIGINLKCGKSQRGHVAQEII